MTKENPAKETSTDGGFKLNYKRTFIIGFAFFGILLLWQVYDTWCPKFLSDLFMKAFNKDNPSEVQYLVGVMMALDNLAALIMLPIFGRLSDKTHTKIGKRMPFILIGTLCCAIAFPFIPVFFHFNNIGGTIAMMAIVIFFAMMYRNPAVALMPDITPKPLRSKANGIINIMGYIGGAFASICGMIFVLTTYLDSTEKNIWIIEAPFLIASILMVISCVVLFFCINENKIAEEMKDEMQRGEEYAEVATKITDDDAPMSKENKTMLILILAAEFLWFMADNGINTFFNNFSIDHLGCKSSFSMVNVIVGGVGSVIGFALGGIIASKIGRKWSIFTGLGIVFGGLLAWTILTFAVPVPPKPEGGYNTFPFYIYIIWFLKGFGMSLVHVNSFPMVVELCSSKKIGRFTGLYYASSMAAQTITPIALGSLMLIDGLEYKVLPIYALVLIGLSAVVFFFIKNVKTTKTSFKKGLESMDVDD